MRIVAVADTHHRYPLPDLPPGDLLLFAGDACMFGDLQEFCRFAHWFNRTPFTHRVWIPGNHDRIIEKDTSLGRSMVDGTMLIDKLVEVEGIRIYGSPYTPEFCNWAFMESQTELEARWARMPSNIDILLTHGPPHGYLDEAGYLEDGSPRHVGDIELWKAVKLRRPKYHIFGHVHAQGGKDLIAGPTKFMNVSLCDSDYLHTIPAQSFTYLA